MPSTTQLLILGNGFDVHCGLESRYEHFFRKKILNTTTENFGVCQMQAGVSGFWEDLLFHYYSIKKNTANNWADVETIIKDTLWTMFVDKNDQESEYKPSLWKEAIKCLCFKKDPKDWEQRFPKVLDRYLFMYCYAFYLPLSTQSTFNSNPENLRLLLNHLLQELHSFERRFCRYLKENLVTPQNAQQLNSTYIINAVNMLAKLTGFTDKRFNSLQSIFTIEQKFYEEKKTEGITLCGWKPTHVLSKSFSSLKNTYILSFNYTSLFDLLDVESPCIYSNVHGKLCHFSCSKTCDTTSIIFGIDDNLIQLDNSSQELRIFSKTYRKMFDTSAPTSILPPNNVPLSIMFYGHSLSKADYSYFQSIFDYYDIYSNNKVNLIFYFSEGYEQTDAIYELINSYGKTLSNKDQGKNLIHKLLLENRLKIEQV